MTHIRVSREFKNELLRRKKRGETIERTILRNMHPIDKKLELIFRKQDARRRNKFKKKK